MTSKGEISLLVRSMIADKLQNHGIELYDIEYQREQNGLILRIYIDTASGVDTDTCVTATRAIKDLIDTLNDLDYDYLEVSSPGIERILRQDNDFIRFQGSKISVKTSQNVEGRKKFIGILAATTPERLSIEIDGKMLQLNRDIISIVRLHPDL
jgi:ribosome maturation factor RimP